MVSKVNMLINRFCAMLTNMSIRCNVFSTLTSQYVGM